MPQYVIRKRSQDRFLAAGASAVATDLDELARHLDVAAPHAA